MREQYIKQKERFKRTKELSHILLYEIDNIDAPETQKRVYEIASEIIKIGRVTERTPEEYILKIKRLKRHNDPVGVSHN